ncbi:uncharacterized protein LOC131009871 [Salvia miltiorrhiza]|uniref:uncharacterized protein LOC131009871 n=1 Tax=Salvia miltiorrhiza TaxID=226208 RepID=UPI0025ACB638|nr:uncharacterized protein LOC131009871 [Salvia miltiorrhiza]
MDSAPSDHPESDSNSDSDSSKSGSSIKDERGVIRASQGEIEREEDEFRVKGGRGGRSGWWKKVLSISRGEGGNWFRENMVLQVGEGESTRFWKQRWVGERSLEDMFPRLFHLNSNKEGFISEMGGKRDAWKWKADVSGAFSVKTAYKSLSNAARPSIPSSDGFDWHQVWKTPASFKAVLTAWKVLKQRMATCDNLQRRHVPISYSEAMCTLCKSNQESIEHLFFECQRAVEVWNEILVWIGKVAVNHHSAKGHFLAFTNLGRKEEISFLTGVWSCTIWCMWKQRNGCKFNQEPWNKDKLIAEIKSRLWSWRMAFDLKSAATGFRGWFAAATLSG